MTRARIGVVLAGGRATRMGGDKAGAMLAGRTLLARSVGIVVAAGLEPRVCARAGTLLPAVEGLSRHAVWREPAEPSDAETAHPLAGLAHAARAAGEPIVALPVDLPLLPAGAVARLAAQPEPLALLGLDGRPAGLVVRLGPEHAEALASAATDGAPALRTLQALGAVVIDLARLLPDADRERALVNVNSRPDLDRVAALLNDGGTRARR